MQKFKVKDGEISMTSQPNVEFVDPIANDMAMHFNINRNLVFSVGDILGNIQEHYDTLEKISFEKFTESWAENIKKKNKITFPNNFFTFLISRKKKYQESLLKNYSFSIDSLSALFYKAYEEFGFLYSFYRFEKKPKMPDNKVHPDFSYLQEDGTVLKVGKTNLSDGELKSIIKQRNVVVAKFLDNGKLWHCFLHTYKGITGEEIGNIPHIHYISSAFGSNITREIVLKQLQKGKYDLPSMLHINFETGLEKFAHVKPPIIEV